MLPNGDKNGGALACGGSLIASNIVLTAAHCFDNKNKYSIDVRIGQDDIDEPEIPGTEANIADIKVHENYEKGKGIRLTPPE